MTNDPSPLKYMGTQSQETVAMAAALAQEPARSPSRMAGYAADAGSRIGDAAQRALGKTKSRLESAAGHARDRATGAVASYTQDDPVRAVLIAAGVGALLMSLVAMVARSGVRSVKRRVRR
jgi:ElaB/YqjD/DUF883 family membrane-anchored ribosome-binding protein